MKMSELRKLDADELLKREKELREDLFKLRFQHGVSRLENPAKLKLLKRSIAQVKTVMVEQGRLNN